MEQTIYSISDIKKNPQAHLPDWKKWLGLLNEKADLTGWEKEYDAQIGDKVGTHMILHSRKFDNDPVIYTRTEMVFSGLDLDKWICMMADMEIRKSWDETIKDGKIIVDLVDQGDICYMQMKMPFPLSDREVLQKRFLICNKSHPKLVEKFGFPQKDNKYYMIFMEPIKLKEYPLNDDHVRAEMIMMMIVEEMADKPGSFRMFGLGQMNMGGWIPNWTINLMSTKVASKMMDMSIDKYHELDKKGTLKALY
jgi:hypothetical protein